MSDLEGKGEAWVVFFRFDGVDCLPGDAELFGQYRLGPPVQGAEFANSILHA